MITASNWIGRSENQQATCVEERVGCSRTGEYSPTSCHLKGSVMARAAASSSCLCYAAFVDVAPESGMLKAGPTAVVSVAPHLSTMPIG